ncbi:MAG: radical SAM protein [Vicinamibacterales bacterium]
MARVLWIRPPLRGLFPTTNTGGPARNFPVGLAYLNAVAGQAGHESEIVDCLAFAEDSHVIGGSFISPFEEEKLRRFPRPGKRLFHVGASWERIADAVRARKPDVVGISCMFSSYHLSARKVAEIVKAASADSLVVLGGQHATSLPHSALESPHTDCILVGEAETSISDFLAHAGDRRALGALPGVGYRCGTGFCSCTLKRAEPHLNPRSPWNTDLDRVPFPDPGNLSWASYAQMSVLITSRGCPLACTFCSVHDMVGKAFRSRSAENVADEIEHFVRAHGIWRFNVEDDNFTWDIDRVRRICRAVRARNLKKVELWLPNGITAIKLEDDVIGEMIDAGFRGLFIGLETTDQKTLVRIKKGFTSLDTVTSRVAAFRKKDKRIVANASLIIGLPGQTLGDFAMDIVRLRRRGIAYFANPYYAVPGSPDRHNLIACGKLDPKEDPSLTEPWSFHASFEIDSESLYWAQLAAYSLARPDVFFWFRRFAATPAPDDWRARAFARWLSAETFVRDSRDPLRRLARLPGLAASGLSLCLPSGPSDHDGAEAGRDAFSFSMLVKRVNAMQFEPYSVWRTPKLQTTGHAIAADFVAMSISLATNSSIAVEEERCANAEPQSQACVFRFGRGQLPPSAEAVRRAFVDAVLRPMSEQ